MKVKVIKGENSFDFEESVNKFLETLRKEAFEIKDIKFSTHESNFSSPHETLSVFIAMIIYEKNFIHG